MIAQHKTEESAMARAMMGSAGFFWSTGGSEGPSIKMMFADTEHLNLFIDAIRPFVDEARRLVAHSPSPEQGEQT